MRQQQVVREPTVGQVLTYQHSWALIHRPWPWQQLQQLEPVRQLGPWLGLEPNSKIAWKPWERMKTMEKDS